MKYLEKISLYNRDNLDITLNYISDTKYTLKIPKPFDEYVRIGYADSECKDIQFVDPSGGPFIQVGSKIYDKNTCNEFVVNKIYFFKTGNQYSIIIEL